MAEAKSCRICGDTQTRMTYGVLCCSPCKIFFRRNAALNLDSLECVFGTDCNVTINSRSTSIQTLDLFQNDRSLLTTDQWSRVSNIIHAYDQQSPSPTIKSTIASQAVYPSKIRLKIAREYYISITQTLFQLMNQLIRTLPEFRHMSLINQRIPVERNIHNIAGLGGICILHETGIYHDSCYLSCAVALYGHDMMEQLFEINRRSDNNTTLFKLFIPILVFSTSSDILLPTFNSTNNEICVSGGSHLFSDTLYLLKIQNFYVEIMFKYMLYKYGYKEAVSRFAGVLKISMDMTVWQSNYNEDEHHEQLVRATLKQLEQTLTFDEVEIE